MTILIKSYYNIKNKIMVDRNLQIILYNTGSKFFIFNNSRNMSHLYFYDGSILFFIIIIIYRFLLYYINYLFLCAYIMRKKLEILY